MPLGDDEVGVDAEERATDDAVDVRKRLVGGQSRRRPWMTDDR